ncbi:MAG: NAD(P)-dependent alcohol dehydrogenase [Caulobacteraceae bacterium]|nr:NAD(P)-dependent alcohol dehydrogenase [Caulobacteraceae bacterium]
MRALELAAAPGIENLQLVRRPKPTPGPGEVRVRMTAASLNHRDLGLISGRLKRPLPITPFSDGCGVVDAIGPGVTEVEPGERVVSLFFQDWEAGAPDKEKLASALAYPLPGVGREYAILAERGLARAPDFLTDQEAATLPCAALTAWQALMDLGRVRPGATVVLLGTGGVSIFALQFALAAGCRTIITSSSDSKLAECRRLGAHETINYRSNPDWAAEVVRLTGAGADLVVEVGGAGTLEQSVRAVKIGGEVMVVGALTGRGDYNIAQIITTCVTLRGLFVGSREMFSSMCRAIEMHKIRPVIDRVYPWSEASTALRAMERGEHFGKIVLDFSV